MEITGIVLIEPGHPAADGAVLTVRLLDVSRLDAASITLAQTVVQGVSHRPGDQTAVPFTLRVPTPIPAGTDLSLDAHLALDTGPHAESAIHAADLVTVTSNPVPPEGATNIVLLLRRASPQA
jgi:hypothetical protein